MSPLKVRKIKFTGSFKKGVFPKDAALAYINKLGVNGGVGYAYEFTGPVVETMDMEGRMTLCNLAIEGGARIGYCNPDQKTFDFLKDKPHAPKDEAWSKAIEYWKSIASDPDAVYDDEIEINCDKIAPFVTWGITPEQSVMVNENIPQGIGEAYDYMDLKGGTPIAGTPIDIAFVGSCTNGRLGDLKAAAEILKGKKVNPKVKCWIVPGSQKIKKEAEALGLDKIFIEAGAQWREAGCSLCLAMNPDKLQGKQISASSSNRNFKGRQGSPTGRTLLMSPAMVAAAAIEGCVVDIS
jgi:3-isopropylmalate/(R)-2-methylmalate dehydratase large subunit